MLCLVPCFFIKRRAYRIPAMAVYVVISGVTSSMYVIGIIDIKYLLVLLIAFYIKFGLFPFMYWVYMVGSNSKWLIIIVLTVFFKVRSVYLSFALGGSDCAFSLLGVGCLLSLIISGAMFWVKCPRWYHVWCHMTIRSRSVLYGSISIFPREWLCMVYGAYFV